MIVDLLDLIIVEDFDPLIDLDDAKATVLKIAHKQLMSGLFIRRQRDHPAASALRPIWQKFLLFIAALKRHESSPPSTVNHAFCFGLVTARVNVRLGSKVATPPRAATGLDTTARRAPYPPMRDHDADVIIAGAGMAGTTPVSYTHLTLPTKRIV